MSELKVNLNNILNFVSKEEINSYKSKIAKSQSLLENKTGKGNDFLGWLSLPNNIPSKQITEIEKIAEEFRAKSDIVVIIGIGVQNSGGKAEIER